MPKPFDPYHTWLGIAPHEQPANYYRLLGVPLFESDADVIQHGADKGMAYIRTFQSGERRNHAVTVLNKLADAQNCLLNAESRAKYDAELRANLRKSEPKVVPPRNAGMDRKSEPKVKPPSGVPTDATRQRRVEPKVAPPPTPSETQSRESQRRLEPKVAPPQDAPYLQGSDVVRRKSPAIHPPTQQISQKNVEITAWLNSETKRKELITRVRAAFYRLPITFRYLAAVYAIVVIVAILINWNWTHVDNREPATSAAGTETVTEMPAATVKETPAANPRNGQMPEKVVRVWQEAGAEVGWMGENESGVYRFRSGRVGLSNVLPAFQFDIWTDGVLSKMPDPGTPFGFSSAYTSFSDTGLKELAKLRSLQSLDIAATRVTDVELKELAKLKSLQSLDVRETEVSDAGLKELAKLNKLKSLDLSATKVTNAGLNKLARMKHLRSLNLAQTRVTDAGVKDLRKALPDCRIIY